MNAEPLNVRLRRASILMGTARARLWEKFEEIEDALWDKAMRPAVVPLPRPEDPLLRHLGERFLRWDGEFLHVSWLGSKKKGGGGWHRLTEECDEIDVLLAAVDALPALLKEGGIFV